MNKKVDRKSWIKEQCSLIYAIEEPDENTTDKFKKRLRARLETLFCDIDLFEIKDKKYKDHSKYRLTASRIYKSENSRDISYPYDSTILDAYNHQIDLYDKTADINHLKEEMDSTLKETIMSTFKKLVVAPDLVENLYTSDITEKIVSTVNEKMEPILDNSLNNKNLKKNCKRAIAPVFKQYFDCHELKVEIDTVLAKNSDDNNIELKIISALNKHLESDKFIEDLSATLEKMIVSFLNESLNNDKFRQEIISTLNKEIDSVLKEYLDSNKLTDEMGSTLKKVIEPILKKNLDSNELREKIVSTAKQEIDFALKLEVNVYIIMLKKYMRTMLKEDIFFKLVQPQTKKTPKEKIYSVFIKRIYSEPISMLDTFVSQLKKNTVFAATRDVDSILNEYLKSILAKNGDYINSTEEMNSFLEDYIPTEIDEFQTIMRRSKTKYNNIVNKLEKLDEKIYKINLQEQETSLESTKHDRDKQILKLKELPYCEKQYPLLSNKFSTDLKDLYEWLLANISPEPEETTEKKENENATITDLKRYYKWEKIDLDKRKTLCNILEKVADTEWDFLYERPETEEYIIYYQSYLDCLRTKILNPELFRVRLLPQLYENYIDNIDNQEIAESIKQDFNSLFWETDKIINESNIEYDIRQTLFSYEDSPDETKLNMIRKLLKKESIAYNEKLLKIKEILDNKRLSDKGKMSRIEELYFIPSPELQLRIKRDLFNHDLSTKTEESENDDSSKI